MTKYDKDTPTAEDTAHIAALASAHRGLKSSKHPYSRALGEALEIQFYTTMAVLSYGQEAEREVLTDAATAAAKEASNG